MLPWAVKKYKESFYVVFKPESDKKDKNKKNSEGEETAEATQKVLKVSWLGSELTASYVEITADILKYVVADIFPQSCLDMEMLKTLKEAKVTPKK